MDEASFRNSSFKSEYQGWVERRTDSSEVVLTLCNSNNTDFSIKAKW